jgi:cell division protein FtsB
MKILDLKIGRKEIERAAREEHGMLGQGEVVYVFPH